MQRYSEPILDYIREYARGVAAGARVLHPDSSWTDRQPRPERDAEDGFTKIVISRQVQHVVVEVPSPSQSWWAPGEWGCENALVSGNLFAERADDSPTQSEDEEAFPLGSVAAAVNAVLDALLPGPPSTGDAEDAARPTGPLEPARDDDDRAQPEGAPESRAAPGTLAPRSCKQLLDAISWARNCAQGARAVEPAPRAPRRKGRTAKPRARRPAGVRLSEGPEHPADPPCPSWAGATTCKRGRRDRTGKGIRWGCGCAAIMALLLIGPMRSLFVTPGVPHVLAEDGRAGDGVDRGAFLDEFKPWCLEQIGGSPLDCARDFIMADVDEDGVLTKQEYEEFIKQEEDFWKSREPQRAGPAPVPELPGEGSGDRRKRRRERKTARSPTARA